MRVHAGWILLSLLPLLILVMLVAVEVGASGAGIGTLLHAPDVATRNLAWMVIAHIRAPRVVLAAMAGAALGAAGATISPFLVLAGVIATRLAVPLNAMLLGEADAALMGYPVERTKRLAMLGVAASVGPVVAFVGAIGFVGVVVPHLVRLVTGPDHRLVLPGSALLGAILLTAADTIARLVAAPAELPVGIITAALGTPVFVWLLSRIHGADIPS